MDWITRFFRGKPDGSGNVPTTDDIGSDVPIRSAKQDRLRRSPFAARIAVVLKGPSVEEGRVFAIRGAWGTGKSSLKNMIIEELGTDANVKWLDFNPWQWADGDAITKALFREMADRLGGKLSKGATERARLLRQYGSVLTQSAGPLKQAATSLPQLSALLASASVLALAGGLGLTLPSATTVAAVLAAVGIGAVVLGAIAQILGRDRWSAPLDEIRLALEKSLRNLDRPLIVFVDDIDRLEPEQIRLLIRQVKVNANLPNITFVLRFQSSIVEAGLEPIANGEGRAFLEKIVQANFDLPSVPRSMVHAVMTQDLATIAGKYAAAENGFKDLRWGNALLGSIQPLITNLRDARRYLSSVAIHLPLHVGKTAFEVNIIDFLALEALRVFEPNVHSALFEAQNLLLQSGRFTGDRRDDEHKGRVEALVALSSERNRDAVRAMLKELFPGIGWAFGGSHYSAGEWGGEWSREKRVCTPRFFPRYFELQTPDGELSESEFRDVLLASDSTERLSVAVESLRKRNLTASLAARMDEAVDDLPVANASVLLPAMFSLGQSLVDLRSAGPFNSPWTSAWRAISWYARRLPEVDRGPLLLAALRQSSALSVGSMLIHLNSPDEQSGDSRLEPAISSDWVQQLKGEWIEQVSALARDGRLLDASDLGSFLFRWHDYTGSDKAPKLWVAEAVATDEGLAAVVSKLMQVGRSHSAGDFVTSRYDMFDRSLIETFFDANAMEDRLTSINRAVCSQEQLHALDVLGRHLAKWKIASSAPESASE